MNISTKLDPKKKTLILINNIGSPEAPTTSAVKDYLAEFLMDKEVIDIPYIARWILVNLIILPRRPSISAKAYEKIWSENGSPLRYTTQEQSQALQLKLNQFDVDYCMRYGTKSIADSVKKAVEESYEQILFFPLYPQYSTATTRSAVNEFKKQLEVYNFKGSYQYISEFCEDSAYIQSVKRKLNAAMEEIKAEHCLFSFHGIPEKMLIKNSPSGNCFNNTDCYDKKASENLCYRSHCFKTAKALMKELGLSTINSGISFQSRLGREKWLSPYTANEVVRLAKSGIKNLVIVSPSFVTDCLETTEELGMEAKELFLENGGENFKLVRSLNTDESFIQFLADKVLSEFSN